MINLNAIRSILVPTNINIYINRKNEFKAILEPYIKHFFYSIRNKCYYIHTRDNKLIQCNKIINIVSSNILSINTNKDNTIDMDIRLKLLKVNYEIKISKGYLFVILDKPQKNVE
jgi:GR25 family glycosyltransferase involved in LPS biosynthesis